MLPRNKSYEVVELETQVSHELSCKKNTCFCNQEHLSVKADLVDFLFFFSHNELQSDSNRATLKKNKDVCP